jgi:hypothetical protein
VRKAKETNLEGAFTQYRRLTLMRTPVVKRQTLPKSGCCQFFPLRFMLGAVRLWQRVLSSFPSAGTLTCLHQTYMDPSRLQGDFAVVDKRESRLHTYIRPIDQKQRFCGPDGMRALSPHHLWGLEGRCLVQVEKEPVRPVLPSV